MHCLIAILMLFVAWIVLRIVRHLRMFWMRALVRLGLMATYAWCISSVPAIHDGFGELAVAVGFILCVPLILFSVVCALAAPTFKAGKPPEFF